MKALSTRHKWADGVRHWTKEDPSYHFKTERECVRCGMVRATLHEPAGAFDAHSVEYWHGLVQVHSELTPPCDSRIELEAARIAASVPA